MKKIISALLLTVALMVACGSDDGKGNASSGVKKTTVAVAVTPSLDCLPLYVARETGIADSMQVSLVLQTHLAKADCDSAIINGSVAAAMTDFVHADFIAQQVRKQLSDRKNASKKGVKVDSVTVIPHDNLQLYVYTNSKVRIKEAKQLADKMVAVDRKGATALVARHVLDSVKLSEDKAFLVHVGNTNLRKKMILANIMDAVVVPEPYSTAIRKAGNKAIYSTGRVGEKAIGCVAVRKDARLVRDIYNRACDSINKNGIHHYDSILVKRMNVPAATVSAVPDQKFKKLR